MDGVDKTMKYIKQNFATIKPVEFSGNTYYQIGTDDWNIVVGLGGLVGIIKQANKFIKDYMDELEEEESADYAVVTRCKDCEYCRKLSLKNRLEGGYAENVLWCMNHSYGVWPTDFCSYGKRKENK